MVVVVVRDDTLVAKNQRSGGCDEAEDEGEVEIGYQIPPPIDNLMI